MRKVDFAIYTTAQDCILWDGAQIRGYGVIYDSKYSRNNRYEYAHRRLVEEDRGARLTKGLEVGHKCGVKLCVSIDHLVIGTRAAIRQMYSAQGRPTGRKKQTMCRKGLHELKAPNLMYITQKNGTKRRHCKECHNEYHKQWQRQKRGFYYGGKDVIYKTHCKNGHERTEANTKIWRYRNKKGKKLASRICMTCRNINAARRREDNRRARHGL